MRGPCRERRGAEAAVRYYLSIFEDGKITKAEIDRYWSKLTANGGKEVQCGWLVDKFGVS